MAIQEETVELQMVAPFAGAWIEILAPAAPPNCTKVAPFAGAWIEIFYAEMPYRAAKRSLPSRERGLKSPVRVLIAKIFHVAPFAGAWIEISPDVGYPNGPAKVAPFAGAWIEIQRKCVLCTSAERRSLRGSVD